MNIDDARKILIEHSRSKANGHFPEQFTHAKDMTNPLCGDHVEIKIRFGDEKILEIGFAAKACAICSASSSILCDLVLGKSKNEVFRQFEEFEKSIIGRPNNPWPSILKGLESFEHLRVNPARRACALLPWVVLKSALKESLDE